MGSGTCFYAPSSPERRAAEEVATRITGSQKPTGISGNSTSSCQSHQVLRAWRNPLRLGCECLLALIVLISLHCDMVRGREYAVIEGQATAQAATSEIYNEPSMLPMDESEKQRIQDLVLRGLNITRIPRASEVSSQKGYDRKIRLAFH